MTKEARGILHRSKPATSQRSIDRAAAFTTLTALGYEPEYEGRVDMYVRCPTCKRLGRFPGSWPIKIGKAHGHKVSDKAMVFFRDPADAHANGTLDMHGHENKATK